MTELQEVTNYIFVKQNSKETRCLGFSKDYKTISEELKQSLYKCYYKENKLIGVIAYNLVNGTLNILFAHLSDKSFNEKLKELIEEVSPKNVIFSLPNDNLMSSTIEMKVKSMSYALESTHSTEEVIIPGLGITLYEPYIFEEYASLHKNIDKQSLKQIVKNKKYHVLTMVYNNELIGYVDIYKDKSLNIEDLYIIDQYKNKEFIKSIIYFITKTYKNKIYIVTSEEILINTLLELGFKVNESAVTYYL